MTGDEQVTTVAPLSTPTSADSGLPRLLTRVVWLSWLVSLGALAAYWTGGRPLDVAGLVRVDGLTVVMWATVTFFGGIVHSYSRRYLAGSDGIDRFFRNVFGFTLTVAVLVAADNVVLFGLAWLSMGLLMAALIGHVDGWAQADAAASLARRYFLLSSGFLAVALGTLWWTTGATTVSGVASAVGSAPTTAVLVAAGALLLAAMAQSALLPFHTWLLSSMTAPTPASALMHAGFVNAGGILLVRFAPVVTVDAQVMLLIAVVGAASALGGKLLKTVQTDVKRALGCSTVGQMGFMILQAGLGFFGAAITHLVLHGFYKAYHFLASGSNVSHESPESRATVESVGLLGAAVIGLTALAGGVTFALLTGKGTEWNSGVLLTGLVVLTVLHAAREMVGDTSLPTAIRYGAVPVVALPAIALYAAVYTVIGEFLAGLPAVGQPAELTVVHGVLALAFLAAYLAVETGVYERSEWLYVRLLDATQPPSETLLTSTEEYNEY